MRGTTPLFVAWLVLGGCEAAPGPEAGASRAALDLDDSVVRLAELSDGLYEPAEALVRAPWGSGDGAFGRESSGADVGPMALAAEPDGGVAVLDTVGARINRYGADGAPREVVATEVETADDLVALDDGALALLVYHRLPAPRYEVRQRDRDGRWRQPLPAPAAATLPTGLFADGASLLVEQRHGDLLPLDGGARRWGRPAGSLQLRALREPGGLVVVEARDRQGERRWVRRLECPWPVTEIRALEAADALVAVVVNHVFDESGLPDGEAGHESWLVAFAHDGRPLGRARVQDSRITDATRPFALARAGDLYEMLTDEDGLTVLRHRLGGGR